MELLQQAVEQRLFRCAPHLAELQWLYLLKLGLQRLPIHGDHRGLAPVGQRIARNLPHRRQLDQSLAVQLQHQPATYHVAQGSVGLHPVPCLAEFFGKLTSARRWMFTKELANEDYLAVRDYPAPIRSEEHTSELQSRLHLVCRLLLEKKKQKASDYDAMSSTVTDASLYQSV